MDADSRDLIRVHPCPSVYVWFSLRAREKAKVTRMDTDGHGFEKTMAADKRSSLR